jgi:hypothetical protein
MEYIEFDSAPAFEECQLVGPDYRPELARIEAQVYAIQIRNQFPNFDKVKIQVKTSYGNYTTFFVRIGFDPECSESVRQAFEIEESGLDYWTKDSKITLKNLISIASSELF